MSFLEKEGDKKSSIWDWVIGIGLIAVIGGTVFFYQSNKRSAKKQFAEADSLFQSGNYLQARDKYENLKEIQYLTPENDSLLYVRLDSIESVLDAHQQVIRRAKQALKGSDTAQALQLISKIKHPELLSEDEKDWVTGIKSASR